eukprot:GHVL01018084.1.p2 GENE.GHVL01018084.1~~GHVL01018084.1.p2  ORF type:complete len:245 (+),score=53.39 GHVL01018084.1:3114-3848(+)
MRSETAKTGVSIDWVKVDLSKKHSIIDLASHWSGPLHVLINCAVNIPPTRIETSEGIEGGFATNVLGYYWMIRCFEGILSKSHPGRIINISDYWAGWVPNTPDELLVQWDDLELRKRKYDPDYAYRMHKQMQRMMLPPLSDSLYKMGVTINACYPGHKPSATTALLKRAHLTDFYPPGDIPVWLATEPSLERLTGGYFEEKGATSVLTARDNHVAKGVPAPTPCQFAVFGADDCDKIISYLDEY